MTYGAMRVAARRMILAGVVWTASLGAARSGVPVPEGDVPSPGPQLSPAAPMVAAARPQSCVKPADLFDIDEYNGPMHQLVARFSQQLEIKTVHPAPSKPGLLPCSLTAAGKFHLFVEDTFEPVNLVDAAWNAGWAQVDND